MNFWTYLTLSAALQGAAFAVSHSRARDSQEREDCYAQEKIYHKPTNKCYKLLTKGPCPRGQWFVLEKPKDTLSENQVRIEAKCVKEKCKDGEYYWSDTRSCIKPQDKTNMCRDPSSEELVYNVFGEGECSCMRDPPRARLRNDRDNPCHVLYTQGPCRPGEVLGFRSAATDEPSCIPDPCYYEARHRKRVRTLDPDAVLAPWRNGTCYELGTQGPCLEGYVFKVHFRYMTPKCTSLTNAVFDLYQNCFQDELGTCQAEIKSNVSRYKQGLLGFLRATRKRRNSDRMGRLKGERRSGGGVTWRRRRRRRR